jgi:hypothetical protein
MRAGNRPGNSSGALRLKSLDVRKIDFETRFLFLFNELSLHPNKPDKHAFPGIRKKE